VVEAVLNHVSGHRAGVAGVYNRSLYAAEKRDALVRWGSDVENLVSSQPPLLVLLKRARRCSGPPRRSQQADARDALRSRSALRALTSAGMSSAEATAPTSAIRSSMHRDRLCPCDSARATAGPLSAKYSRGGIERPPLRSINAACRASFN